MKSFACLAAGICLSLFSCSSGNEQTNNAPTETKNETSIKSESFATGQVIDKVVCKGDTSQSYALYLPSDYAEGKNVPVVFAFDPHGTGKLPVAKYKNLAEKYH